jgi:subtilase family serine protease
MPKYTSCLSALCAIIALSACGSDVTPPSAAQQPTSINELATTIISGDLQSMCAAGAPGKHHCLGYILTFSGIRHLQNTTLGGLRRSYEGPDRRRFGGSLTSDFLPAGYGPTDFQKAYGISSTSGASGRVVALVEAGDAPTLENDLNVYRAQYGLPLCTVAQGCLHKLAQDGSSNLPAYDSNWAGETQLDADMVSALCPNCAILVVEASNEGSGLDTAENTAAQSAFAISNSWGGPENAAEASYFNHPGIIITAAAGDGGYNGGPQSPADFSTVIAVGSTSLMRANNARGWSENVWAGTGGGCSTIIAKPSWQKDLGCGMRTISDTAFVGDPSTGVAMYDSNLNDVGKGPVGWRVAGGTSVGAPAIAALFALAGVSVNNAATLYANIASLNNIVSGSNGTCATAYLCSGEIGYNAPSGNGTPNGLGSL